ncbi:MAG: hypothetical protein KME57_25825 [Scytonema hyalinum WJT4-NPBG1]|nr:hypothetical protein [Scytonema hyalinum WJT4-NPBG1]
MGDCEGEFPWECDKRSRKWAITQSARFTAIAYGKQRDISPIAKIKPSFLCQGARV